MIFLQKDIVIPCQAAGRFKNSSGKNCKRSDDFRENVTQCGFSVSKASAST